MRRDMEWRSSPGGVRSGVVGLAKAVEAGLGRAGLGDASPGGHRNREEFYWFGMFPNLLSQ
jgi:hypothetical protein